MKYITTDKHPEMKEGIEFKQSVSCKDMYVSKGKALYITHFDSFNQIEDGYIKEVEEKEFTKSDMIDFVHFAVRNYSEPFYNIIMARSDFNKWKKQRNNKS